MIATLADLPPIALDEVIALADLQTRRDRKYLLPAGSAAKVLGDVQGRMLEIDGRRDFRYESVYFDTDQWDSYLSAARRRPRRFKVRTRTYRDSGECVLEVKVRDQRGNTVKLRRPHDLSARDRLTFDGTLFVGSVDAVTLVAHLLRPVLTVAYRRSTLVLDDDRSRVTVDRATTWATGVESSMAMTGLTLIETKTAGPPSAMDRALWRAGHRPVTISKYCTGMALMRPDLPANKWHRVLRQRVVPNICDGSHLVGPDEEV